MGFRFYRRVKIAPGVSLNLGKSGASVSVGPRGAKMTFGKKGVKTSVGIPGTGMRYETPYRKRSSNPPSGEVNGWFVLGVILGVVAYLCWQLVSVDKSIAPPCILAMIVSGLLSITSFLIGVFKGSSNGQTSGAYSKTVSARYTGRYEEYIKELIGASANFFAFLRELNRSTRCRNLLNTFPGMENLEGGNNSFTINKKLGIMVYCDLRDCFRELGNDPKNLEGLCGIGYAMMMVLLVSKNADLNNFLIRDYAKDALKIISEMSRTVVAEINIEGHEEEFRFGFLFGTVKGEHEWVNRYATLMYRWASLLAKADGVISDEESAVLAAIMKMKESANGGNVRVNSRNEEKKSKAQDLSNENHSLAACKDDSRAATETPENPFEELDGLIGLAPVKTEVKSLASFIKIQQRRTKSGLKAAPVSYHCVFTGNPGTGKTTVARILADIYRELGVVKKGHLVETDRSGLIGEYVGQTAVKTNKVIDSALDGVLFIDEAYSLIAGGQNDYGAEAIATLLKRMEDDRGRLIVILAGYTNEMKKFIDSNPGLQSRFNRYIEFPDYSAEELAKIFMLTAEKCQYECDADVRQSITTIMESAVQTKDKNFGNGRFVRNLFERAIQRQAVRLSTVAPLTTKMLSELTLHDLGYSYE